MEEIFPPFAVDGVVKKDNDAERAKSPDPLTERSMYLKIINHKMEGEVSAGDVVQSGIIVRNSELEPDYIFDLL